MAGYGHMVAEAPMLVKSPRRLRLLIIDTISWGRTPGTFCFGRGTGTVALASSWVVYVPCVCMYAGRKAWQGSLKLWQPEIGLLRLF